MANGSLLVPRTCDRAAAVFASWCAPPSSAPPRPINLGSSARLRSPGGLTAGQAKTGASPGACFPSASSSGAALIRACRTPDNPASTFRGPLEADRCKPDSSSPIDPPRPCGFSPDLRAVTSATWCDHRIACQLVAHRPLAAAEHSPERSFAFVRRSSSADRHESAPPGVPLALRTQRSWDFTLRSFAPAGQFRQRIVRTGEGPPVVCPH